MSRRLVIDFAVKSGVAGMAGAHVAPGAETGSSKSSRAVLWAPLPIHPGLDSGRLSVDCAAPIPYTYDCVCAHGFAPKAPLSGK